MSDLVAHSTDDDAMLLWLTDRSPATTEFTKRYLLAQNGTGTDHAGAAKPFTRSGPGGVRGCRCGALRPRGAARGHDSDRADDLAPARPGSSVAEGST
ncbi:hypothetical protein Amsp01_063990 [Amycolatopsis sp. NBRC 101858]|uniref:hypothetical protein n=1 Tax=Amycolatopsis sp. NBRC 101858 TaxID=3032200 RepID=UPI0024A315FB|nr:hypothetical protein [Amycolatopsis sp. NBRC 101858]GLY40376.1 hypothetical protein Amsp01_063990 [Amycolatopsis sp. NBRC 101858]